MNYDLRKRIVRAYFKSDQIERTDIFASKRMTTDSSVYSSNSCETGEIVVEEVLGFKIAADGVLFYVKWEKV